jgi:hypothetical protein
MEMLVWQLRANGEKLPKDALDGPHRGWLRVQQLTVAGLRSLHADLHASASYGAPQILRGLSRVELRKVEARGMLLVGLQHDLATPITDPGHRQAWFCQLVPTRPEG